MGTDRVGYPRVPELLLDFGPKRIALLPLLPHGVRVYITLTVRPAETQKVRILKPVYPYKSHVTSSVQAFQSRIPTRASRPNARVTSTILTIQYLKYALFSPRVGLGFKVRQKGYEVRRARTSGRIVTNFQCKSNKASDSGSNVCPQSCEWCVQGFAPKLVAPLPSDMAHLRQSRPDFDLCFHIEVLKAAQVVRTSLESGRFLYEKRNRLKPFWQ